MNFLETSFSGKNRGPWERQWEVCMVVGTFVADSMSKGPQGSEKDFAFYWFILTGLQSGLMRYLCRIPKSVGKAE